MRGPPRSAHALRGNNQEVGRHALDAPAHTRASSTKISQLPYNDATAACITNVSPLYHDCITNISLMYR